MPEPTPPPNTPVPPRIDSAPPELLDALARVTEALQGSAEASREVLGEVKGLRKDFSELGTYTVKLARHVGFSDPPPPSIEIPPYTADVTIIPVDDRADAAGKKADKTAIDLDDFRREVMTELRAQSRVLGIGAEGLRWFMKSSDPAARAVRTLVAALALFGAARFGLAPAFAPPAPLPVAPASR